MFFVLPEVLLLFSFSFVVAWLFDRDRTYLLWCSFCYFCIGLAMLMQLADVPEDPEANAVFAVVFYIIGILAGGHGLLKRSKIRMSPVLAGLAFILIVGATLYYLHVSPNLTARVYVLNGGISVLILAFTWKLRALFRGPVIDRMIVGILCLLGLQFLPRTMLTVNSLIGEDSYADFALTPFWHWTVFTVAIFSVLAGLIIFATAGVDKVDELIHERDTDLLTGLLNRRGLEMRLRAQRKLHPSGWVAVCDIDYFKSINDFYGHAAGDGALKEFADLIRASLIDGGLAARTGGEEFVLFLKDMDRASVIELLDGIRGNVRAFKFSHLSDNDYITCSFGSVRLLGDDDFWQAVERADRILYEAKEAGRNRTFVE